MASFAVFQTLFTHNSRNTRECFLRLYIGGLSQSIMHPRIRKPPAYPTSQTFTRKERYCQYSFSLINAQSGILLTLKIIYKYLLPWTASRLQYAISLLSLQFLSYPILSCSDLFPPNYTLLQGVAIMHAYPSVSRHACFVRVSRAALCFVYIDFKQYRLGLNFVVYEIPAERHVPMLRLMRSCVCSVYRHWPVIFCDA